MATPRMCRICPSAAVTKQGLCESCASMPQYVPRHERERKRKRGKRRSPPLKRSVHWERLAKAYLASNPYCVRCALKGRTHAVATEVDHIISVRLEPKRELDRSNLQAVCHRCHSVKTGLERGGKYYDYAGGTVYLA